MLLLSILTEDSKSEINCDGYDVFLVSEITGIVGVSGSYIVTLAENHNHNRKLVGIVCCKPDI